MIPFIPLREICPRDSIKLVKLKKKYNHCATMLNFHCEGMYLSGGKKAKLLHELFLAGKEINEYE